MVFPVSVFTNICMVAARSCPSLASSLRQNRAASRGEQTLEALDKETWLQTCFGKVEQARDQVQAQTRVERSQPLARTVRPAL